MSTPPPNPDYIPGPIWPPDWSQFIPDAIGAILTGAVIGIFLWRIQNGAEKRRAKLEAESLWEAQRGRVAAAMEDRALKPRGAAGAAEASLRRWERLAPALDPRIPGWADDAPKNPELQAARQLLVELPEVIRLVGEARQQVAVALQRAGAKKSSDFFDYWFIRALDRYPGDYAQFDGREDVLDSMFERVQESYLHRTATTLRLAVARVDEQWVVLYYSLLDYDSVVVTGPATLRRRSASG